VANQQSASGLEVNQPGQPPCPCRAFGSQQMLAHDLGVQQHRRPGRRRDLIEESGQLVRPWLWQAKGALLAEALRALPCDESRPVPRPPVPDRRRRHLV
jgi:hypothetical protein